MATYRVGEAGATVYKDGEALATLRPGYVIQGVLEPVKPESKRVRNYADKAIHPAEDK